MKRSFLLLNLFLSLFIAACSVQKPKPAPFQNIADMINKSPVLNQHQVGFILQEIGSTETMFQKNADDCFIPASSAQLFTFYTALNTHGDSIPSFWYAINKDSMLIWPMADASFLHPKFKNHHAFNFLKNAGKNIYLISGAYKRKKDALKGPSQTEISEFPIYGNSINVTADATDKLKYYPDLTALYLSDVTTSDQITQIKRGPDNNNLTVPITVKNDFKQTVPLYLKDNILEDLLSDTLLATGQIINPVVKLPWRKMPKNVKTVYGVNADSLYKLMLHQNDNFISDELLLNCAAANKLAMSTNGTITFASKKYLADYPYKIQWADASGLSTKNLFVPRDLVTVLQKTYSKIGNDDRLFNLFPAGSKTGSIKNMFKTTGKPYVYATSGSLSNNYVLSGYLIGASGKKYAFAFMNNALTQPVATVKAEVERVITFIRNNY